MSETWEFTLLVVGPDLQSDDAMNALAEAGCDDATVSSSSGVQSLDFDREATSYSSAVTAAIREVEHAVGGARVARVLPDEYLSLADIAERTGRTRESVRLLSTADRGPGGFPPPASRHEERHKLWRWSEVGRWFADAYDEPESDPTGGERSAINACLELSAAIPSLSLDALQVIRARVTELDTFIELFESIAGLPRSEERWWSSGTHAS